MQQLLAVVTWVVTQLFSTFQGGETFRDDQSNNHKAIALIITISINLLAFYHERCSLIGYATHYLFGDGSE